MAQPKSTKQSDVFISAIIISDQFSQGLVKAMRQVSDMLKARYTNYEIVLIDNFTADIEIGKAIAQLDTIPCARIIRLSRSSNKDVCVFAGLETAIGDVVVLCSPQDPLELMPDFIEEAKESDVVFGVSKRQIRAGFFNRNGSRLFYWYNRRYLAISIPPNSTYFMALKRRAVNALTYSNRFARHIRYLARQIGFKTSELYYDPPEGYTTERRSARQLMIAALELVTNYSKHPLRFVTWVGFSASLLNLMYAGYVIIVRIAKRNVVEGWTTLSLQSSVMFFLLFTILALLCEYMGRVLEETRGEPPYYIADELSSKITVADSARRNITY